MAAKIKQDCWVNKMPELNDLQGLIITGILVCGLCYLLYKDHVARG